MINSKRIMEIARKWQKQAMRQRVQVSLKTTSEEVRPVADEGYFVIYTTDGSRFVIPLTFLNRPIFRELLLMAEEEFGFTGCGPLRVPCEAFAMEYIVSLLRKNASRELDKALAAMASCRTSLASLALHETTSANMIHPGF
ncbi:hypothetical protein AMTRI_Chr09g14630 [Amborella trichopoda]|uniref:auxin-responsive protein SAUR36-like n=1 Tax=Amborella trichopoda TaxID=13333 RepID=UPI0005D389C7|nr:auxin-responsive protein SAUR36-like [Amborella trichopoda]|eukprot:XP_011629058.1 auxin-responsive protein SAUR36-like [Amborella trichopoda]